MKLYEIIKQSDLFPRLQKLFPSMVETSKEVEVIPWRDEFAVADKNPEVIEALEFYRTLLSQKLISEEEYEKYTRSIKGYASKTLGIAFIEKKEVSFRSTPTIAIALHELGHIHFQEPDPIWSSVYGGGMSLMWLGLNGKFYVTEQEVRLYHSMIHDAKTRAEALAEEMAKTICSKLDMPCYPHIYALDLCAGTIPFGLAEMLSEKSLEHIYTDLESIDWRKIKVDHQGVWHFLLNMMEGIKWADSFYTNYAVALGLIKECPVCSRINCQCD